MILIKWKQKKKKTNVKMEKIVNTRNKIIASFIINKLKRRLSNINKKNNVKMEKIVNTGSKVNASFIIYILMRRLCNKNKKNMINNKNKILINLIYRAKDDYQIMKIKYQTRSKIKKLYKKEEMKIYKQIKRRNCCNKMK